MEAVVRATGTNERLLGVRACGPDVVAVGTHGAIRRWDGEVWSEEASGTTEDLYAVASARDFFVAVGGNLHIGGDSSILRREEGRWLAEPSGMQHILLAVAHGGAGWFAAGYNGGILRGGPGAWERVAIAHYSHVFALLVGETQVLAAGLGGTLIALEGDTARAHRSGTEAHLRGLDGVVDRDVLAVGLAGTILRYSARGWFPMESPMSSHLEAVWFAGESEAYAVGYGATVLRFDGKRWSAVDAGIRANLHAVHGNADEVVAVGGGGVALHLARRGPVRRVVSVGGPPHSH